MSDAFGRVVEESIANPDQHWRTAATSIDWIGKILRSIVNGDDISSPSTIDDPTVPETIRRHIAGFRRAL